RDRHRPRVGTKTISQVRKDEPEAQFTAPRVSFKQFRLNCARRREASRSRSLFTRALLRVNASSVMPGPNDPNQAVPTSDPRASLDHPTHPTAVLSFENLA